MKKLFIAIWFIIAIMLIPVMYNAIDNINGNSFSVSFNVTDIIETEGFYTGLITNGTFDNLIQYVEAESTELPIFDQLVNLFIDGTIVDEDIFISKNDDGVNITIIVGDINETFGIVLGPNGDTVAFYNIGIQENTTIRIESKDQPNGIWPILLSLMPLVFVGGLIVYFVKKNDLSN